MNPKHKEFRLEGEEGPKFSVGRASRLDSVRFGSLVPHLDTQVLLQTSEENSRKLAEGYQNLLARNLQLKAYSVNQSIKKIPPVSLIVASEGPRGDGATEDPLTSLPSKIRANDKQFSAFLHAFK